MQDNIVSILFIIAYLTIIWILLLKIISQNYKDFKRRKNEWKWIFIAYFLLGFGDLFHLGFRIYIFFSGISPNTVFSNMTIGLGFIISGITMTYFYIAIFHAWSEMYGDSYSTPKKRLIYAVILYLTFLLRIGLVALPFNHYFEGDPTGDFGFDFRIITAIPTYIIGTISVYLLFRDSKSERKKEDDDTFKKDDANYKASIWYLVSYFSYSLTILFVAIFPITGLFMIPKTIAYLIAFYYHYTYILNCPIKNCD